MGVEDLAFDAWTRGIHALEKTAASACGEAKRIEGPGNASRGEPRECPFGNGLFDSPAGWDPWGLARPLVAPAHASIRFACCDGRLLARQRGQPLRGRRQRLCSDGAPRFLRLRLQRGAWRGRRV